ncbi:hypothetical protein MCAMS1_00368 [biofilm metagenome]
MKTASDMRQIHLLSPHQILTKNNIKSSKKVKPRQKFKQDPSKTLAQQLEQTPKKQWIAVAAYFKAEMRGFVPGLEIEDWLEAEQDYLDMVVQLFLSVFNEDGLMTMTGLRQLAKAVGVNKPERIDSKLELIRQIQQKCNHLPCFRTQKRDRCVHKETCLWQADCQKLLAEWLC